MNVSRSFNGLLVFSPGSFPEGMGGEETMWIETILLGGKFNVTADGFINRGWVNGLSTCLLLVNPKDQRTEDAIWEGIKNERKGFEIPVRLQLEGSEEWHEALVSKESGRLLVQQLQAC